MQRFQNNKHRFAGNNLRFALIFFLGLFSLALLNSCYSFTGSSLSPETKTIQIREFPNNAALMNPN